MLAEIGAGGEQKVLEYARKLDRWDGDIVLSEAHIAAASDALSQHIKDDIQFAYDRVRTFAEKQREALIDFEMEITPGLFAGQKQIPMRAAGCYVPGGRYAHVASAVMSVATAKAAGVEHVVVCSPPKPGVGVHPAIVYTANLCGADRILEGAPLIWRAPTSPLPVHGRSAETSDHPPAAESSTPRKSIPRFPEALG